MNYPTTKMIATRPNTEDNPQTQHITLALYSWNINGLDDVDKANKIQHFRHKNPGIYLLQEIHSPNKYSHDRLTNSSTNCFNFLKPGTKSTSGVALCIPNNDANLSLIPSSLNLNDNNHRWIHSSITWFGMKIHIINIYAPSGNARLRSNFLTSLEAYLNNIDEQNIILAGDFNCYLDPAMDSQSNYTTIKLKNQPDQRALRRILQTKNLIDIWRSKNPESHQCTYGRTQGHKISRLDHIYVSESIAELTLDTKIIQNNLADHNPVYLLLKSPNNSLKHKSSWRLNSSLMQQQNYNNMIRDTISRVEDKFYGNTNGPSDSYTTLKSNLCRKSRRYAIGNNRKLKSLIQSTQEEITRLESVASNFFAGIIDRIQDLKNRLHDLENQAFKKAKLNAATTSADTSEKATKLFFNSIKPRINNVLITALKTTEGTIARTQSEIAETACAFYEDLYQNRPTSLPHIEILLGTIKKRVTTPFYQQMNNPITAQEVKKAISWIASGRAPGPDGLGSEFYKKFNDELSNQLASVYNECIEKEALPECMSNATIHLLFKKGDPQNLGNWRPISLLNVDYKILAKIINDRMKTCMPDLIHMDQKGFVQERNLHDAVQKTTHLIRYCQRTNLPAYLMLLDQEKAFDRVARDYLHKIIETTNFPPLIRKAIKAMYASTTANINVNGQLSRTVQLLSGVRQGCPLSPTLFALCIEPLGNLIRTNTLYKGIHIPNSGTYKISKFADDTTFIVKDQEDHDIALEAVRTYELASAAKANVSKTEILPIGPNTHTIDNPLNTNITQLPHNASVRFLGVKIGNNVDTEAIWNEKIDKLEKCLSLWSQKFLTYEGRVFILKQQALASIWFQAKFHYLPPHRIKQIESIIKKFINNGKNRTIINYSIMKRPKESGGLGVPDIELYAACLRASWIQALLDQNNHAEWKQLAKLEIDAITNSKDIGANILNIATKRPKRAESNFWAANLKYYHQLGGKYDPELAKLSYTPTRLLNEPISTFHFTNAINSKITKMSDIIKEFTESGAPILLSPKSIKTKNNTNKTIYRKSLLSIEQKMPNSTIPPLYVHDEDEKSPFILEITEDSEPHTYKAKRFRPNEEEPEIFKETNSPHKPFPRNFNQEIKEILAKKTSLNTLQKLDQNPSGPRTNPLTTAGFTIDDENFLPLATCKLIDIYQLNITKRYGNEHIHYANYDRFMRAQEEWSMYPNRKTHPALPKFIKNYRFQILHNRLYIGRQLAHLPDIDTNQLKCPNCEHQPNNIEHMFIECPHIQIVWHYVANKWNQIIGSFEDFTDIIPEITPINKLLGTPTIINPRQNHTTFNTFIFCQTLDLLLGNIQFAIVKLHHMHMRGLNSNVHQLPFIFDHRMAETINKIYNRMRKPPYIQQWLYKKPRNLPRQLIQNNDWTEAVVKLLRDTLARPTNQIEHPTQLPINLTSALDSQISSDY